MRPETRGRQGLLSLSSMMPNGSRWFEMEKIRTFSQFQRNRRGRFDMRLVEETGLTRKIGPARADKMAKMHIGSSMVLISARVKSQIV